MKCSKSTHMIPGLIISTWLWILSIYPFICQFCQFHDNSSSVIITAEPQCLTSQQGVLGDSIVFCWSPILITITMVEGNSPSHNCRAPTPHTEDSRNLKMYAIKQIKIDAEYRDMLPRPRQDLSVHLGFVLSTSAQVPDLCTIYSSMK